MSAEAADGDAYPGAIRSAQNRLSGLVGGNVVQAGSIGEVTITTPSPAIPVPMQLPPTPHAFVNRSRELRLLTSFALDRARRGSPPLIVFSGMGGVGKTAIALHWAHANPDRFEGGRLYADLAVYRRHGGVDVGDVLASFLRALGVHQQCIPVDFPERVALFRSRTATTRVLVVLDNADQPAQVRSLIPGSPGSAVLVTSRQRLSGLAIDGAEFVDLHPLNAADSASLMARMVSDDRAGEEQPAVHELVQLCAGLPIALRMAGARLAQHKRWSVARLVEHLSDERERLGRLSVDEGNGVKHVFDVAYADLPPRARRMYCFLGLNDGPDFALEMAAAAADVSTAEADDVVDLLCAANLVEESGPDRYRFHDLVRLHAKQCAERDLPPHDRERAVRRIVDWYSIGAAAADRAVLGSDRWRLVPHDPSSSPMSFEPGPAMEWLEKERSNLLAAVRTAAKWEWHELVWQLCESLWALYHSHKNYADWIESHEFGVVAAQRCGNRTAETRMRNQLARAHLELGAFERAREELDASRETASGHVRAEALVHESFGLLHRAQGRYLDAADMFRQARGLHEQIHDERGAALQAYQLGDSLVRARRVDEAVTVLEDALAVMCRVGDELGAARIRIALGTAYDLLRRDDDARMVLVSAIATTRSRSQPVKEAQALEVLVGVAQRVHNEDLFRSSAQRLRELNAQAGGPITDFRR